MTKKPLAAVDSDGYTSLPHESEQDANYAVIRRNGQRTDFDRSKISTAISKAFLAAEGDEADSSSSIHESVERITEQVVAALFRRLPENGSVHIEDIQDQVELALMRSGFQKIARAYVLYREQHKKIREQAAANSKQQDEVLHVTLDNGERQPLNMAHLQALCIEACEGLNDVNPDTIINATARHLYDGVKASEVPKVLLMSARTLIEQEPNYSRVSARLLLDDMRQEALGFLALPHNVHCQADMAKVYGDYFRAYLKRAIELELLDSRLGQYDVEPLIAALLPERDLQFSYLGLQTLYDRYFIHHEDGTRFELPQVFFMRVAMGLAINEVEREARTIEFYQLLSSFDFMSSTPTLFNSGTLRPQLSSCYLTTVSDDLDGIYSAIKDNAMLSKFAGGLGNDWSRVRGMGGHIRGTNGKSQGVVPFLKVANDTAVAVNQGGKRKGAVCAYLETWHIDIEDFLELRKNTGDERRRTHDMNSANWIPDLFMRRVAEEGEWTLFSPHHVPDLHDLYGNAFTTAYEAYEEQARQGHIKLFKTVKAVDLWRKMLGMLFETGHPWITFKDPCNLRYTNQHVGQVHSSNLCTEITLHTNDNEIAVCNLGSVNLPQHVTEDGLDVAHLQRTIRTAMRMLDNVIDYNYYAVPQARNANMRHRPVGLGIMGFQDSLYKMKLPYASIEAVEFADRSMEQVAYFSIEASCELAAERGAYSTFKGSLWSQGILPYDSLLAMREHRGDYLKVDESITLDWDSLRERIQRVGMRNSNTMAIAPTATISNICGVSQSIEPSYQNIYVKSNLSGEFMVVNDYLVRDLKARGLWDRVMANDLKYYDGSTQAIERIPEDIKTLYATAFEMDSRWLIEAASRRQKWIDQAQSVNLYLAEPSGKAMDQLYKLAWVRGLKTTYYLRSMGATQMEKTHTASSDNPTPSAPEEGKVCSILDPDCEACQ
jgi:ribonucleoside-diphosphate reductase alpha chain